MTPAGFKQARQSLGLTQEQIAPLLGYADKSRVSEVERGVQAPGAAVVRLMQTYVDGYRPADWPKGE
jgi:transcriptional regulator with XRE-family HTH domain